MAVEDDDVSLNSDELELPPMRAGVTTASMRDSNVSSMRDSGFTGGVLSPQMSLKKRIQMRKSVAIFDDKGIQEGYASVPLLEIDLLPRGGISFETKAVGRIQFGIPPETIKDSMQLGMDVPRVYIVPVERFCREQGPSLGVNLAEFEFPAYFTYFVRKFKCVLVVDSPLAETEIRSVFGETLLGPAHFRNHKFPLANVDEDFDPSFPRERRPNFYKELGQFRANEKTTDYDELETDTLIDFIHFNTCRRNAPHQDNILGVPPDSKLVQFGNGGSINIGSDSDENGSGFPNLLSPLLSPGFSGRSRRTGGLTPPPAKPTIALTDDRMGDLKTIVSMSSHSESSSHHNAGRRGSLPSQVSQPSVLIDSSEHSSMHSSFGRLPRRNSDGSISRLSQGSIDSAGRRSSTNSTMRRSSIGSLEEKPQSARLMNKRVSWTPKNKLFMNASQTFDSTPISNIRTKRRDSTFTNYSSRASTKVSGLSSIDSYDFIMDDEPDRQDSNWMYSQAKWLGDVATVYPPNATDEEKRLKTCPRVEIFKMAGGTEYIVHDIDKDNIIIGKIRFSGTVQIPDEIELHGFISNANATEEDYTDYNEESEPKIPASPKQSTFHPPSFGVTVLGNSHGFDKNGTTSGYVLWVNGRGIMVDPPPYSNATLEREGIRPQMIMGIIITHCHADHDAGAFQKVMRGSRVAIITTPTIYDSFIRKYSALSGLKQSLLRHSHRLRPAIIGQPLRFQGAIFHFTYTLHTIPCISFRAEWRGKSIVFTGDHMNIPDEIERLQKKGVLSKARAEDLLRLPLQKCDVLLHEAGAPPIHTPLAVLQNLPEHIRDRLYVVHTAAIPPDSGLKVAPIGTAGTLRLDSTYGPNRSVLSALGSAPAVGDPARNQPTQSSARPSVQMANGLKSGRTRVAPLVFLRPTDVSDAWFILNLLSAVPFLSSLSYGHTMEFLEIAHVEMYCQGEVVIEGNRRSESLCVFWEGVCSEKVGDTVWYAGDWTGPPPFETDQPLHSHQAEKSVHHRRSFVDDIVAISEEGVKVITLPMKDVRHILHSGSKLFRKYLSLQNKNDEDLEFHMGMNANSVPRDHSVLELIQCNSVLRNLNANQRITLESLAEGPRYFAINAPLWQAGDPVEYAMIIVEGSATIGTAERRRSQSFSRRNRRGSTGGMAPMTSISEQAQASVLKPLANVEPDKVLQNINRNSEYSRLLECLQSRADEFNVDEEGENSEEEDSKTNDDGSTVIKAATAQKEQRDKFANKVLARFGDLATINKMGGRSSSIASGGSNNDHHCHTSTMLAGKQGCVAMVFPKSSLVPFLDANPGLLLSLLGTKVLV
ncbi:unnamed protein product [Cylindrotheca closterium]|uniref:Metallo-beta-lactamase domain-containing protein n=1 Tax=Cylindrotheca closterium TaxID=2856 RepID=A0AAD2G5J6_9STRA|nr:unnamed protein product [Cylindrotheca closterium]